jgi:hypothetical protein
MNNIQEKIDEILSQPSTARLLSYLDDDAWLVRANAIEQLGLRISESPAILKRIVEEARNPANNKFRGFGFISLSYVAIATLLKSNNLQAKHIANQLFAEWDESDRDNLLDFLETQNLTSQLSSIAPQLEVA